MDQLDRYRTIVRRLIEEYASYKPAYGDIRTEAVVDREHDHYEVMQVGWDGGRRVHGSIIHIDIRDGKVWIEHNGTDARLGEELVAAGIPRSDIVLGFHPEEVRPLSGFPELAYRMPLTRTRRRRDSDRRPARAGPRPDRDARLPEGAIPAGGQGVVRTGRAAPEVAAGLGQQPGARVRHGPIAEVEHPQPRETSGWRPGPYPGVAHVRLPQR